MTLIFIFSIKGIDVYALSIKVNSLNVNKQTAKVGEVVNISSSATGSKNLLYKYSIYDGVRWYVLQDYSTKSTTTWKPYRASTSKIKVEVKDKYSSSNYSYKQINYEVYSTVKIQNITTDVKAPQLVNTPIKITTNTNLPSNVLYKYSVFDGQAWSVIRDYTYDKSYIWKPSKAGNYKIKVDTKEANSLRYPDTSIQTSFEVKSMAKINSISFDKPSPSFVNVGTTVTAYATGTNSMLYKFLINDGSGWKVVKDYSSNNKYVWTPTKVAKYNVRVEVKDSNSKNSYDNFMEKGYEVNNTPQIQEILTNVSSPRKIGNTIVLTAKSIYGSSPLYRYWINDGTNWIMVKDYSSDANYTWSTSKEGSYKIKVDVKDKNSLKLVDSSKEISFEILKYGLISYSNTNLTLNGFLDSQMKLASKAQTWSSGIWIDATRDQVQYYLNPNNFISDYGINQFLKLNFIEGISVDDLNKVLIGKGVLQGKGATFLEAGRLYNVNPVYLVAHSLLETGNGTSKLATGISVNSIHESFGYINSRLLLLDKEVKVYNVYGYGAYDSNPDLWGSEKAYNEGWFTVDQAIIGGAKFISKGYINNLTLNQNTLYKMRWDINTLYRSPSTLYAHQYATDIGWAYKQSTIMKNIISKMTNSMFYYEIPKFIQ